MRRRFKRNRVIVGGIDQQWRQMDLADIQSMQKFNDCYCYLLVCIDVFSEYAWVVSLKNKTGPTLIEVFKVILSSGGKPEKIMTDWILFLIVIPFVITHYVLGNILFGSVG
jgi:hypothetical protein